MPKVANFAFSADPLEFMAVQNKADEIATKYPNMSRSVVFRTILIDALGGKPLDPDMHAVYLDHINEALRRV